MQEELETIRKMFETIEPMRNLFAQESLMLLKVLSTTDSPLPKLSGGNHAR
jgi:hypothetical protein